MSMSAGPEKRRDTLNEYGLSRLSLQAGIAIQEQENVKAISKAKRLIGFHLTKYFGGCSIMEGYGFWSHQGDEFEREYDDPQQEALLWINLMIMPDQLDQARACIKECGELLRERGFAPDLKRIHCELTVTEAHHITVGIGSVSHG